MEYFFQGWIMGIAYTAPIGMQNLFVINTALNYERQRALLISFIIIFFDITLSLACFFGVGTLIEYSAAFKLLLLSAGSLFLIRIGFKLIKAKSVDISVDIPAMPIHKIIYSACIVSWFNPQAILDGTMLLGSFHAILAAGQASFFILGIVCASCTWFTGLTILVSKFSNFLHKGILKKINICCGAVIVLYGLKLLFSVRTLL